VSDTDIRSWAASNGVELGKHGPVPKAVRAKFLDATGSGEAVEFDSESGGSVTLDTSEQTPAVALNQSPAEKIKSKFSRSRPTTAGEVADKRPKRRVATQGLLGWSWVGLANVASRAGFLPVGLCMEMQAPVAGVMLEQVTKGTVVDRMIQPFARGGEKGKIVGALMAPPFIVAAIQQRPQLYSQLAPVLEECLYTWIEVAGPEVAKKAELRSKREEQYGADVKTMMERIFAPLVAQAEAEQAAAAQAQEQAEPEGRPRATRKRTEKVDGG
jgi:hypothetical protein